MLRQKVRRFLINRNNHPTLKRLFRVMIFLGILWILSFPYLARNVFTSENAFNGEFLKTTFGQDTSGFTAFK